MAIDSIPRRIIKIKCVWCNAGKHEHCTGTHIERDYLSYKCVCEICARRQPSFAGFEFKRVKAGI